MTINAPAFAKVIIEAIVQHYGLLDSIVSDWNSVFTLKLWLLLHYFLEIKQKLSTVFHP